MTNIVCAKCKTQFSAPLQDGGNSVKCINCKCNMECQLVRIRAKRSRGYHTGFGRPEREFNIRVIDPSGERLISFVKAEWGDFELRSKDQAVFTYLKGELRLIQNLTVALYFDVEKPVNSGCVIALVLGFIAAAVFAFVAIGAASRN